MSDELDALKETAKAAQEVAKTAGKAVDGVRDAGGWLDRMFGKGIEHAVGRRWSDRQLTKRIEAAILDWGRLELLFHKVQNNLRKKGVTQTREPPPKIVLPLLENATMELEDDLHTLWANLMTAALDPTSEDIERKYVSVLAEFSVKDALVLRNMFAEWTYWEQKQIQKKGEGRYQSGIGGSPGNNESSVVLMYRLGLVLPVSIEVVNEYHPPGHDDHGEWAASADKTIVAGDLTVVSFTEFGECFCTAVIGDVTGVYEPPDWVMKAV